MSLFDGLLIGHLVADWLLQNDWIARNKQRRWANSAIFVHCTVYTLTLLATLWLFRPDFDDSTKYLVFGAVTFLSHWLIDAGALAARWRAWLRQTRSNFVQVMADQTLHVLVIAALVVWVTAGR